MISQHIVFIDKNKLARILQNHNHVKHATK